MLAFGGGMSCPLIDCIPRWLAFGIGFAVWILQCNRQIQSDGNLRGIENRHLRDSSSIWWFHLTLIVTRDFIRNLRYSFHLNLSTHPLRAAPDSLSFLCMIVAEVGPHVVSPTEGVVVLTLRIPDWQYWRTTWGLEIYWVSSITSAVGHLSRGKISSWTPTVEQGDVGALIWWYVYYRSLRERAFKTFFEASRSSPGLKCFPQQKRAP